MWGILIGLAIAIFIIVQIVIAKVIKEKNLKPALVGGLILAALDIIIETVGAWLGLWTSTPLFFAIGGAPISMLLIAFFGGTFFLQISPKKRETIFLYVMVMALACTFAEAALVQGGFMQYLNWNSFFCFLSYIPVLYFLIFVYKKWLLPRR